MTSIQKMIAAAALIVVWGALVALHMAPAADYVSAIRDALIALGVFTASMSDPKG